MVYPGGPPEGVGPGRGAGAERGLFSDGSAALGSNVGDPGAPGKAPKVCVLNTGGTPPIGFVRGVSGATGEGGGSIGLLRPADVLRAASALLDASSKATATKMENEGFIGLPQLCVANSTEVSCNGSLRCSRVEPCQLIAANNATSL